LQPVNVATPATAVAVLPGWSQVRLPGPPEAGVPEAIDNVTVVVLSLATTLP
jgi:hypothetical protein